MRALNETTVEITDRGISFTKTMETEGVPEKFVKTHLQKYRHAMDLSKNYSFKILKTRQVGFVS